MSGRATVAGFTVNAHPWIPGFDPPYSIAVVALEENHDVRLTTNIVGCEPDEVHIGQEVEVRFEQCDDVWIPLFEPTGATNAQPDSRARSPDPTAGAERGPLRAPCRALGSRPLGTGTPAHGRSRCR